MDMLQDFSTLQFPNTEPYGAVSDPSSFNLDSQMDLAPLPTMEIEGFTTQAITMTNPFVTSESTHLPTPQSPGNMANYVVDTNPSPTAPHSLPALHRTTHGASTQMVTPDSSPMVSRWSLPSSTATQTRQRSPQTPSPTQPPSLPATDIVVEPRTPPPGATALLSSPFSPPSHTQQLAGGASYSPAYSPTHAGSASPSLPNAPSGGVLEGIRAARAAMQQETEARRPDYLQRSSYGAANASSGASIAESPMKGRRIELFGFTETSEESFEERLMAGGYIGYGATGGATEPPSTPGRYINDFLGSTPVTTNKRPIEDVIEADVDDATLDEKERRKRKRLQPFMSGQKKSKCMLFPVELEQHGRVLIDLHIPTKEEPREQPETPKRKGGRRRKPRPRGARAPPGAAPNGEPGLHWPDSVFPWSVRTDERKLIERAEEQRKLKAIAHYLDSDTSDSEDSEDKELQPRPPPFLDLGRPKPMPSRGGLGKSIPQAEAVRHNIFVPSDSADARAALLCQRHVRALIALQRAENMALCICGEGDNDRAQVQCDRCYRWYHLRCINIPSIDDLGPYDAQWFCYACEDDGRGPQTASTHAEPTLVRDDALPYPSYPRDPLFYDAGSYDPASPTPSTSRPPMTPRPDPPTPRTPTPAHTSTVRVYETPNTSFSADGIEPFDPSSTPSRGIRQKEGSGTWERARYGGMFTPHAPPPNHGSFSTPANRVGTLLATPLAARASMSLPRFSATFSGQYIPGGVAVEETPIDHSTAKGVGSRSLRGVADSPLMGRDSRRVAVGASGSPSLRAT